MKKRFYTEAEVNADLDEFANGREIHPLLRHMLVEMGKRGLLDAYCEALLDMPEDYESNPLQYLECAVREACRGCRLNPANT